MCVHIHIYILFCIYVSIVLICALCKRNQIVYIALLIVSRKKKSMSVYIALAQVKTIYAAFSPYDYQSSGFIQLTHVCSVPTM